MATVTLNITGMIWFIDNNAAACTTLAAGCGRVTNPFSSLAAFQALNNGTGLNPAATDSIFIYTGVGNYTGGTTLLSGQLVIGQGAGASILTITGLPAPSGTSQLPATGGTNPTVVNAGGNAIALTNGSTGNTIRGVTIGATSGDGINGTNFGTLTLNEMTINTTGRAFTLTTGTLAATIASVTSSGGANNIALTSIGGTLTMSGGALSAAASDAFVVSGGAASITYNGTIANTTARPVNIASKTGGTVAFGGAVSGTSNGILLSSNTGATINFTGGLNLSTGANTAFSATGGGTVNATQNNTSIVNTLTTTTGKAVNANGVTFGASGATFRSISSSGGTNGISLQSTSGNFTVSGDGTGFANGSGGTISTTGGAIGNSPIYELTSSGTLTFTSMNFSIDINGYSGPLFDNNAGGTLTVNVIGCTFTGVGPGNVVQNKSLLQFEGGNTGANASNVTVNVQNSFFFNNRTYGMFTGAAGDSIMRVTVNQSGFGTDVNSGAPVNQPGTTITNAPPFALGITNSSNSNVHYNVTNNTFWGGRGLDGAVYEVSISGATTTAASRLDGF